MKKEIFLAIILVLVVFRIAFCNELEDKRKLIEAEWLEAALSIKITDNHKLSVIHDFLMKDARTGTPDKKGIRMLENGNRSISVVIVPILKEDENIGEYWKSFYHSNELVIYFSEMRTIAINTRIKLSKKTKALLLLQEAFIAHECIGIKLDDADYEKYLDIVEESAQEFQNKLLDYLGGEQYRSMVVKEAKKNQLFMKKNENKGFFLHPNLKNKNSLKTIFGAISPEEEDFLETSFWVEAIFLAIEKDSGENAMAQKIDFFASVKK